MTPVANPQVQASDPGLNVFVSANAGSGKTTTLVRRVARLLLHGARPEAILCVTYTKAAAAEMQRRLFGLLGDWSVMADAPLRDRLAELGEDPTEHELSRARELFAKALETPGGLKIQTIHAFCERLLRRFPLEAGVTPGFTVLEDALAAEVSAVARERLAEAALEHPDGAIGKAYAHFAVELDHEAFDAMLGSFEAQREAIAAHVARTDAWGGYGSDAWLRMGFEAPVEPEEIGAEAVAETDWMGWMAAVRGLSRGSEKTDVPLAMKLQALAERGLAGDPPSFAEALAPFCTATGERGPLKRMATSAVHGDVSSWLTAEQERVCAVRERMRAATVARDTVHALTLGLTYVELYRGEKAQRRALDFADLIGRTRELLTETADAAWVLFKLDGGVDHILLDEAQDTAPEQWDILHPLTDEFFAGAGVRDLVRTLFVVGDEKQSIYSFQGAAPERLKQEAAEYRERAEAADEPFAEVPLHDSWRSTPEILTFVDTAFASPEAIEALTTVAGGEPLEHRARRTDSAGCVDLWPWLQDEKREEADAWDAPLDADPVESARKRLARRIAEEVVRLEAAGEGSAGDVLVLVRRRDALFEEIIRALKKARVPVAGADRLRLSEHIVFKDLLALARVCLFPEDDLSLASVLRSPFCGVDEGGLFALAHGREGRLWDALVRRAEERPEWLAARDLIDALRQEASRRPAFELFSRLLSRLDGEGRSMRQRLLTRLGREAEDALDAFLAELEALERRGLNDLERVAHALSEADIEVKRELEAARGEVRVMTVHGAKGLEAPIVILPDTTALPKPRLGGLLTTEDGGFLWAPRKAEDCAESRAARDLAVKKRERESLRLLYVALTRARDRLVVAGVIPVNRKGPDEGSWYGMVEDAFKAGPVKARVRALAAADGGEFKRFGADPGPATAAAKLGAPAAPLPGWSARAPAAETTPRWASPTSLADGARASAPSPLAQQGGLGRFRRGELIHKLFEVLPDVPEAERRAAAARLMGREPDLDDPQRAEMIEAVFAVLDDPRFAEVFGEGSRAEAAVAGSAPELPPGVAVSGRLDRLVVRPERVLVIDYKTNRPAPERAEDADPAYLAQMAVYAAVLRRLYPGRAVEAALVWTDGPRLTPLPAALIDATLAKLREAG